MPEPPLRDGDAAAVIVSLALILLAQLVGEALAHGGGVPVPGPVIGAALIFAGLLVRDRWRPFVARRLPAPLSDGGVEDTCRGLLAHLSLLFVPAGVGIVGRLDLLAANGLALALVLVVSVALTLIATALTFVAVSRRYGAAHDADEDADTPASRGGSASRESSGA